MINGPTIANALIEPSNGVNQLVASEKDDNRLVEELFLRVLNRMRRQRPSRSRGHTVSEGV